MARFLRPLLVLCLFVATIAAFARTSQQILVVKVAAPSKDKDGDPLQDLVQFVSQDFDEDGRVFPIAWGLGDPYFRAAVDDRILKNPSEVPDLDEALLTGTKLKVEYVLVIWCQRNEGVLQAAASLYRHGHVIWHDPQKGSKYEDMAKHNLEVAAKIAKRRGQQPPTEGPTLNPDMRTITVTNSGADGENELRSLANTWVTLIGAGPLKSLPAKPKPKAEQVDPGQRPSVVEPPPAHKVDNQHLMDEVMKLLAAHQSAQAITMLRDAVDTEPLDVDRRRALIQTLLQTGQPQMAGAEARRASALLPDKVELRTLAARAFILAGQPDEAAADLKESVARDPNGTETRLLLGEISLGKLQLADAISQFDFVLGKAPTADVFFKRSLAKALDDDGAGAAADMQAAEKATLAADPASVESRYGFSVSLIDQSLDEMGPRTRTLLQRARAHPADDPVKTEISGLAKRLDSLNAFLDTLPPPASHKTSHDQRLLALKLLAQAMTDLDDYAKSQSEDAIGDATITIGEGLKNLKTARDGFKGELKG